jgi:hypothetical protein
MAAVISAAALLISRFDQVFALADTTPPPLRQAEMAETLARQKSMRHASLRTLVTDDYSVAFRI